MINDVFCVADWKNLYVGNGIRLILGVTTETEKK